MEAVRVDVAAGQASATSIKRIVEEMQQIISQIQKSAISGKSGWDGKASTAFETSHTDWHAIAVKLQGALDEIEAKLTAGFRGYEDEDVTVAGLLNGLML